MSNAVGTNGLRITALAFAAALVGGMLAASTAALAGALAGASARGKTMVACDIHIAADGAGLADAIEKAPAGARLCLGPGVYVAGLQLTKSLTLVGTQGADKTVLKGPGHVPVLRVDDDGLAIRLEGLTLQGGDADAGGGLRTSGRGKIQVADCRFTGNNAGMIGGGGIYASAGLLSLGRCTFDHNRGRQGGGVFLDAVVHADLTRCTFDANESAQGASLRITEAVEVTVKISTFRGHRGAPDVAAFVVSGTRSRIPHVTLDHCTVEDGSIVNGPEIPGDVRLKSSKVPASWNGHPGVSDASGPAHRHP